jgi:hypothetical protein
MKKEGHESRFNIKRIEYTLKSTVSTFTGRDGVPGHFVKKGGQDTASPSSAIVWTDTTLTARADIPGDAKFTTQTDAMVFTANSGASLTYYQDGSFVYAASLNSPVSRREALRREQAGLPWWQKDRAVVENEYIYESGSVAADPVYGESKQKGTPYKQFTLRVPVSETEAKEFDVYAYGQAIALLTRRNVQKDDLVRVRVSVQFHEQRLPHGRTIVVPWLNLFDLQKLK